MLILQLLRVYSTFCNLIAWFNRNKPIIVSKSYQTKVLAKHWQNCILSCVACKAWCSSFFINAEVHLFWILFHFESCDKLVLVLKYSSNVFVHIMVNWYTICNMVFSLFRDWMSDTLSLLNFHRYPWAVKAGWKVYNYKRAALCFSSVAIVTQYQTSFESNCFTAHHSPQL